MTRYFKYLLLAVFVATVLLIVFLQYNSNRSINKLIDSNEILLNDFDVKSSLQHLTGEITALESKVKGSIIGGTATDTGQFQPEFISITTTLRKLDTLVYDDTLQPLISDLSRLVDVKMNFSRQVLETYRENGRQEAENLVNTQNGKNLADSIKLITSQIDVLHQSSVTQLIREADNNGRNARTMGTILAIIGVLAAVFTFAFVAYKVQQQQRLIHRLNISEKKARDAALIKENFLANMSHEIRTPLNAIIGFTNLLQRRNLDLQAMQHVQTIQHSGENLLTIINDVLDLSKIEAGMMRIESAPFSIRALLQSVVTMFRSKAVEKKLQLNAGVSDDIPDTLEGDAIRLTQILVNLVGNAIKFTVEGSVDIDISAERRSGNMIRTSIVVRDTGIGIKKEKLHSIFERFQQAEASVTRTYGGTGLGLAIVDELVRLQQGTVQAESEEGKGTCFTIIIPYKVSSANIRLEQSKTAMPHKEKPFSGIRILVAEDNEINQSLLSQILKSWNVEFDMAANGKIALEMLSKQAYNMVLMDIQMPVMDGYSATRSIREDLPSGIPVVAMTAHAMAGEREKCLALGMNEYLSKPIRQEQLYAIIEKFANSKPYRLIDLRYMQEISMGNNEYEKSVTGQFLETIPGDLVELQTTWRNNNIRAMRQVAHNMKTSISVMGLNTTLDPILDQLEYNELDESAFNHLFSQLQLTCDAALKEARHFYAS